MQNRFIDRSDMFALRTASESTIIERKNIDYLQQVAAIKIDRRRFGGIYYLAVKDIGQLMLDKIQSWFNIRTILPFARSE